MLILIVDDNPSIRLFYHTNLARRGYTILETSTNRDAWSACCATPPDLIILEVCMYSGEPDFSLLEQLGRRPIPKLVITTMPEAAERAMNHYSGVVRALVKPITARELIEATSYALGRQSHHTH
jgi:DNA-binding response OmpR family regulator